MNISEPELITIVEGPPPDFHLAHELWPFSLWEGSVAQVVALAQMRTLNGPAMLERCLRAWAEARPVMLDFPQLDGLRRKAEVLAARVTSIDEGEVLNLWVALPAGEVAEDEEFDDGDNAADDEGLESNF
ncbi:MAG TPA: hypothetical protein VJG32_00010 [Anaerolineae bacterium]|nr:hypothetical protein [Anaerolineae bacterium]